MWYPRGRERGLGESEEKVKTFIKDELKIEEEVAIERAHRLGKKKRRDKKEQETHEETEVKVTEEGEMVEGAENQAKLPHKSQAAKPRPIIVKFSGWKNREQVFTASREMLKKDGGTSVSEDFSAKVREARRALIPDLIKYRKSLTDTKVFLRYDTLVVGKDVYTYDGVTQAVIKKGEQ